MLYDTLAMCLNIFMALLLNLKQNACTHTIETGSFV